MLGGLWQHATATLERRKAPQNLWGRRGGSIVRDLCRPSYASKVSRANTPGMSRIHRGTSTCTFYVVRRYKLGSQDTEHANLRSAGEPALLVIIATSWWNVYCPNRLVKDFPKVYRAKERIKSVAVKRNKLKSLPWDQPPTLNST